VEDVFTFYKTRYGYYEGENIVKHTNKTSTIMYTGLWPRLKFSAANKDDI